MSSCLTPQLIAVAVVSYHAVVKCKNAHVSAVVDVIPSDNWISVVFHPDPSQSIIWDLVVFVYSLKVINIE